MKTHREWHVVDDSVQVNQWALRGFGSPYVKTEHGALEALRIANGDYEHVRRWFDPLREALRGLVFRLVAGDPRPADVWVTWPPRRWEPIGG